MIYYLADAQNDTVKIGYTTPSNIKKRFANLKSSNSSQLRLVAAHSGTRDKETFIHNHLAAYKTRQRGEWFHLDDVVNEYIEEHNDFEYFFDVFEDDIRKGKMNQPVFQRMLEAYMYERAGNKKLNISVGVYSDQYKNLSEWMNYVMMCEDNEENHGEDMYYIFEPEKVYVWPGATSTCP